jgi:hypothetical protein
MAVMAAVENRQAEVELDAEEEDFSLLLEELSFLDSEVVLDSDEVLDSEVDFPPPSAFESLLPFRA